MVNKISGVSFISDRSHFFPELLVMLESPEGQGCEISPVQGWSRESEDWRMETGGSEGRED